MWKERLLGWSAPVLGLVCFILLWSLVSASNQQLPGPGPTWDAAIELFKDPFYQNGPNDQGIGWNILNSLERVGIGFGMAAQIGIPVGLQTRRTSVLHSLRTITSVRL